VVRAFLALRVGRLLGLTLFVGALLCYRSDEHRQVFGRWSYTYCAVILAAAVAWLGAILGTRRRARRRDPPPPPVEAAVGLLDLAVLATGIAYWLSAQDARANAARIVDLNLFGSVLPAASLLEWLALLALFVAGGIILAPALGARWVNPAVGLAALCALALLGEGVARAAAILSPAIQGFPTYARELWARRYVHLNHLGFRDVEHAVRPTPGTRRLLVIGDSFAEGAGIPRLEDRFGEQLGGRLAHATGERWEVITASHPDYNTLQELAILQSVPPYRPDVVVLVYVFNDIDYIHPVTPRSVLAEAPRNILQRLHPVRVLFKNSYLFQAAYVRARLVSLSDAAAEDPYGDTVAVRRHLADLARFVVLAKRTGGVVGIVPFDHTVAADTVNRHRYERFAGRALAAGLPVWPIGQAFEGWRLSQLIVNALDAHPNELANRLAAEAAQPQVLAALRAGPARSHSSRARSSRARGPA